MEGIILVLRKNKLFMFICMLVFVLVIIGIFVLYIVLYDLFKIDMMNLLKGLNFMFLLGID